MVTQDQSAIIFDTNEVSYMLLFTSVFLIKFLKIIHHFALQFEDEISPALFKYLEQKFKETNDLVTHMNQKIDAQGHSIKVVDRS